MKGRGKPSKEELARRGVGFRAYVALRVALWWCLHLMRRSAHLLYWGVVEGAKAVRDAAAWTYRKAVVFFRRRMSDDPVLDTARALQQLRADAQHLRTASDQSYAEFLEHWHAAAAAVKGQLYVAEEGNKGSQEVFEYGWGAHSIQFAIDVIPELHKVMLKHYRRKLNLKLVDIGAGSGAGTNMFALLHTSDEVFSPLEVEAVDQVDTRRRWIEFMYPKVKYTVGSLEKLRSRNWDFVYCSHVIEHTRDPRAFVKHLMRICRGFAFVYAPYNEVDLIPGHLSTITEKVFEGFPLEALIIRPSMAWLPQAGGQCILAVIDCRNSEVMRELTR